MNLCLVTNEIFAWGKYGGYGSSARMLAIELAKRGIAVSVVTPRRSGQRPIEEMEGMRIFSYPFFSVAQQTAAYRACSADIYHCLEPSLSAYVVQKAMPDRKHVVTCKYVRFLRDLLHEVFANVQERRLKPIASLLYEQNSLVRRAIQRAQAVTCEAEFEVPRAQEKYQLTHPPEFVPTPFNYPTQPAQKSSTPMVCFIGRWEKRKYPETFLDLAQLFPQVTFVAVGEAQSARRDVMLRQRYGEIPNLRMPGFIDQFSSPLLDQILSSSWILINTSRLEGLPRTFLEAASRRCAILSRVDPDGFASRGGYCAASGDLAHGLETLLQNDEWQRRGQLGFEYVHDHHRTDIAVARHSELYEHVLRAQEDGHQC